MLRGIVSQGLQVQAACLNIYLSQPPRQVWILEMRCARSDQIPNFLWVSSKACVDSWYCLIKRAGQHKLQIFVIFFFSDDLMFCTAVKMMGIFTHDKKLTVSISSCGTMSVFTLRQTVFVPVTRRICYLIPNLFSSPQNPFRLVPRYNLYSCLCGDSTTRLSAQGHVSVRLLISQSFKLRREHKSAPPVFLRLQDFPTIFPISFRAASTSCVLCWSVKERKAGALPFYLLQKPSWRLASVALISPSSMPPCYLDTKGQILSRGKSAEPQRGQ